MSSTTSPSGAAPRAQALLEARRERSGEDESRILTCRHCGAKNRVGLDAALERPERARCGRCGEGLFLEDDEPLTGVSSRAYEHPLDRETLLALQRVPGLDRLLKWVMKEVSERSMRLFNMASAVRCSEQQFPAVHALFLEACRRLDVSPAPELYVQQSPMPNAFTFGVDEPFVVATSALVEMLDEQELLSVFGHELGHWQADHVLYKTMARLLSSLATVIAQMTFGIGRLALYPLQLALLKWDRCSELTADRAALLTVRDPDVVVRVSMKLAGGGRHLYEQMSAREFIRQAHELVSLEDDNLLNKVFSLLQTVYRTHPFPVWRTHHVLHWAENGEYLDILAGSYERRGQAADQ